MYNLQYSIFIQLHYITFKNQPNVRRYIQDSHRSHGIISLTKSLPSKCAEASKCLRAQELAPFCRQETIRVSLALRCGEKEKGGESMVVILQRGSLKTPILVGMEMYGNVWYFSGISPENSCLCSLGWCHATGEQWFKRAPSSWIFGEQRALIIKLPKTSGFFTAKWLVESCDVNFQNLDPGPVIFAQVCRCHHLEFGSFGWWTTVSVKIGGS